MRVEESPSKSQPRSLFLRACLLALLLCCSAAPAAAQSDKQPVRGFQPGGAYAVSDIESISSTGGNLIFNIPLASLPPGRGGSPGESLSIFYNSKIWDPEPVLMPPSYGGSQMYLRTFPKRSPEGNWRYGIGYELEIIDKRYEYRYPYGGGPDCTKDFTNGSKVIKVRMKTPDGGTIEFRPAYLSEYTWEKDGYFQKHPNGRILRCENCSNCPANWAWLNEGTPTYEPISYYSADGTYIRLDIRFAPPDAYGYRQMYWTMYFPDGRRVATDPHVNLALATQRIYDRNGNYTEISSTSHNGHPARRITDQLGRSIIVEQDLDARRDYVHATGRGGEPLVWTITWKSITVRKTFDTADYYDPSNPMTIDWSLMVVDQIILPQQAGGLAYTFEYNPGPDNPSYGWGEVSAVTLPSGARAAYTYRNDGLNNVRTAAVLMNHVTRKDLTYASEYDGAAGQVTDTWRYSLAGSEYLHYTSVRSSSMTAPDGGHTNHYFYDTQAPISSWEGHLRGRVYKTEMADGTVVERLWEVNSVTGPGYMIYGRANPYVKTEFTSIRDAAGNLVKTAIKDYGYDKNGNVTRVAEYDWVDYGSVPRGATHFDQIVRPTGIPPGAPLKRVTVNTYHAPAPDAASTTADSPYAYDHPAAPPLRNTVASTELRDAGGQPLSRAEFFYDDAGTTGNLLLQRSWDSTKGALLGTTQTANRLDDNNSISVRREYDDNTPDPAQRFGNVTLVIDARGHRTKYAYGALVNPVGAVFTGLYPTAVVTAEGTGVQRTMSSVYDFSTGLVTKVTDEDNHLSTSTTYDALGRPTLVEEADDARDSNNVSLERRTVTDYSDALRRVIIRSDLNTTGDGKLVSIRHYDQMGRIRLLRMLEDAATQSEADEAVGVKVQTRYAYGTPPGDPFSYTLVSTPYRAATSAAAASEPAMAWRRTRTERGGRVVEVQTFAGAAPPAPWGANTAGTGTVTTAYDAEYTTVTDQAGRPRRSVTDALGKLVRVDEPDGSFNLGPTNAPVQPTHYAYDALGNLRRVDQGGRLRFFMYDSLSRLLRLKNPEHDAGTAASNITDPVTGNSQWSMAYGYDPNGNVTTRVDARNVTTTYGYDELNRNTTTVYTGETGTQTRPVTRHYDGAVLGKGRLWKTESGQTTLTTVEEYDPAGQVLRQSQKFWTGATWGAAYTVGYAYDLAGNLRAQTYPSGHSVSYAYDNAGRLSSFTGNLGDGAARTYSAGITYDAFGRMSQERFGTAAPVYNKHLYNNRGQLAEIRVSTHSLFETGRETDWNRGALINHYSTSGWGATGGGADNNGNLLKQDVYIPNDDAINGHSHTTFFYDYDSLNRLYQTREGRGGQNQWVQYFDYDRWGNRTINPANTWGVAEPQFGLEAGTNRLAAPAGYTMQYDGAGNLVFDNFAGAGTRTYDAENRMVTAQVSATQSASYTYDADGRRVRRNTGAGEVWQVYGQGGELLAEYAAAAAPSQPQKEYGYRGGQLLITASGATPGWGAPPVINDNPLVVGQTTIQSRHMTELRDAINALRARKNMAAYQWQTSVAPGSYVAAGPLLEMRAALDQALGAPPGGYSAGLAQGQPVRAVHVQELRDRVLGAWQGGAGASDVRWLVADQLGTPRMVLDATGSLAGMTRHDYLPFGEEIGAGVGGRTTVQGYGQADGVRNHFTGKERDDETGLDYFGARYYASVMGRFTTADPYMPSAEVTDPQTWNRYSYVLNNPLKYVDPLGLAYSDLTEAQRRLFSTYAAKHNNGGKLTDEQVYATLDESQMATFEAVTHALENTKLTDKKTGKSLGNALSLVASVDEIVGENVGGKNHLRLYVNLTSTAVGTLEKSKEFGGGLFNALTPNHKRYGKDGKLITKFPDNLRQGDGLPSLQVSYAKDKIQADIDIDYRESDKGHRNHYNSDVRQIGPESKGGKPINNYQRHIDRWPGLRQWWQQKNRTNDYYKGKSKS